MSKIRKKKLSFFGYAGRSKCRETYQTQGNLEGKGGRGRLKTGYFDNIKNFGPDEVTPPWREEKVGEGMQKASRQQNVCQKDAG